MKRLIPVVLLSLTLGACAGYRGNVSSFTQDELNDEGGATAYSASMMSEGKVTTRIPGQASTANTNGGTTVATANPITAGTFSVFEGVLDGADTGDLSIAIGSLSRSAPDKHGQYAVTAEDIVIASNKSEVIKELMPLLEQVGAAFPKATEAQQAVALKAIETFGVTVQGLTAALKALTGGV